MKEDTLEMKQDTPCEPSFVTGNLTDAVKIVYKRYGTDLSTFFDDAYKDSERRERERRDPNALEARVL